MGALLFLFCDIMPKQRVLRTQRMQLRFQGRLGDPLLNPVKYPIVRLERLVVSHKGECLTVPGTSVNYWKCEGCGVWSVPVRASGSQFGRIVCLNCLSAA